MKPKIKEVIIVEGKDDVSALRKAVDADIWITTGLGLTKKKIEEIKAIAQRQGIIIFTDPDFPGGKIRNILKEQISDCKHAYITKEEGRCPKTGRLGVEYAKPEAIIRALTAAKAQHQVQQYQYTYSDIVQWGLAGLPQSAQRRTQFCDVLSIGHTNGKQLVNKLNHYQISPEEIQMALDGLNSIT